MNESTSESLSVLCLHDGNSNATELHRKLQSLDRRLSNNHSIELTFVNSPLQVRRDDEATEFVWWEEKDSDNEQQTSYSGLDASLLHVKQVLASMPFSGFLAVGKGAALASLLPFLVDNLEFGIFVDGKSLLEEDERLIENWPALHVLDPDSESSQHLVSQFGGQVHEGKTPFDTKALNAIGKFLVQQKKRLLSRQDDHQLVLQNQLFAVEQEAQLLVAQHAMEQPPPCLMAAIVPSESQNIVGAWNGTKPSRAGGGAPCPSEFLLPIDARRRKDTERRLDSADS